jgi:DNA-binding response OmpR family regulator
MMPRMDGVTLARRIRARAKGIPVLLMSAARHPVDPEIPFLAKPFDVGELVGVVRRMTEASFPAQRTA